MVSIFKKIGFDKKYFKIALYAFVVGGLLICLEKALGNITNLSEATGVFLHSVRTLLMPFIYGFCIAYLLSPAVMFFENGLFLKIGFFRSHQKSTRTFSIILTYFIIIGCFVWLMTYLIPEISSNIYNFLISLPQNALVFEQFMRDIFNKIPFINASDVVNILNSLFSPIVEYGDNLPEKILSIINGAIPAALTGAVNAANGLLKIIIGVFVGFYMLSGKEGFADGAKKILYANFDADKTTAFLENISRVNKLFQSFIVGKTVDSVIIGALCFILLYLIKAPYAMLISIVVGITNMIPYFGPFIGAVPSIIIALIANPYSAVWVAAVILILQQFDGIILGPKILGSSTGMAPIWIIFSITVGGAILGPLGMFIGVPIFASLKMFFGEYIDKKYDEKYKK